MNSTQPRGRPRHGGASGPLPRVVIPLLFAALALGRGTGLAQVSSADEVCPPGADPCNVTSRIDVAAGAILDFGTRTVHVTTNSGRFFFAGSGGEIRCGTFRAFSGETNAALNVASAERVVLQARRACTDGGRPCIGDHECDRGACSLGEGSIHLQRSVQGNSAEPAALLLQAADHVTIERPINLNSQSIDSDGGALEILAAEGDVTLAAALSLTGGGGSTGGMVQALAGRDIILRSDIDVRGGDFDGGAVEFAAGRDIAVTRSIHANAATRAGSGGVILLRANRDLAVTGASQSSFTVLSTDGSTDAENFAGDGGTQEFTAGRHLLLGSFTRFRSIGSQPDGFGGDLLFEAGGDFVLDGQVQARAAGGQGGGGILDIAALGNATFGSSSSIALTGGGGFLAIAAGGDAHFAGSADVGAGSGGDAGSEWMTGGDNLTLAGSLTTAGSGPGELDVGACRLVIDGGGLIDNASSGGVNRLLARESLRTLAGSTLRSAGGSNVLVYRDPANPPLLAGIATPTPTLQVDPELAGCTMCGNGGIGGGGTCDDGVACTADECSEETGSCVHTPLHDACDNGIHCDGDEVCDPDAGCLPGEAVDCSHLDGECTAGICDEGADGCVVVPTPEAPSCDAPVQDRNQQRCLGKLLKAARGLAGALAQEAVFCVHEAARGRLPADVDAAICLDADLQGRIARARSKLQTVFATSCRTAPDFGFTDEETVSSAYVGEWGALLVDAFPDLDTTLEGMRTDDPTGRCAVTLPAGLRRIAQAMHKEAEDCIRSGLRSLAIGGSAGIAACLDEIVGDPAGKIGKAAFKLGRRLVARCEPGLLDRAFPGLAPLCDVYGRDNDAPGLALCTQDRLQCRLCRVFRSAWGIERDCDVFDDGEANGSCPECGNGVVDPGEECDDGPLSSDEVPDACRSNCTLARCGDGVLDAGEECDDGNGIDDDGCTNSCTVCGNGIVTGLEECDDGNLDGGDCCSAACDYEARGSACDGPSPTGCTAPACDGAGVCDSLPANDGAPCDDGDACSLSSSCSGGTCTAASRVLSGPACGWMVVANAGVDSQRRLQIGNSARADGPLCSNFATAGSGARIGGDLVTTGGDPSTDGVTFGDTTTHIDSVDVVTANSRVRASTGTVPGLDIAVVAAGQLVSKSPSGVYDTTGSDPRVADCQGAQSALSSMLGVLDNLPTTHDFGATHASIGGSSSVTIQAPNAGGLNVFDFTHLEGSGNVTVNLHGGGNQGTVVVMRIAGRLASSQNWTWNLIGGLTADRLLFYVRGSTNGSCTIGESNAGGGTLLCPNTRAVIKRQSVWDGAVFGGGSTATAVELNNSAILNHVAFTAF